MEFLGRKGSGAANDGGHEGVGAPMKRTQTLIQLLDTKTISMFGGITLLFNNMTGPAVPQTPNIFQQSGWIVVTIFLFTFSSISALCSLFIVEAMQAIPGNKHFQGTVEFGTLIHFYFGRWAHILGQICLYGALETNAIASMIQTSQTFDNILIDIFGKTYGLALTPSVRFVYATEHLDSLSPFGDDYMLFTLGYLMTIIAVYGLTRITLSESIWVQIASFVMTFMIFLMWIVISFLHKTHVEYVPMVGNSSGFGGLIGVIMLNFSFCQSVPSWINIKKSDVNVQGTLWLSTMTGCLTYVFLGIIPAFAYLIPNDSTLLSVMGAENTLGRIVGYFFSVIILLPSIPVFMVIEHANLEQNFEIRKELTEDQKKLLKKIHWQSRTINQFIDQYAVIKGKMLQTRASSMALLSGSGMASGSNMGLNGGGYDRGAPPGVAVHAIGNRTVSMSVMTVSGIGGKIPPSVRSSRPPTPSKHRERFADIDEKRADVIAPEPNLESGSILKDKGWKSSSSFNGSKLSGLLVTRPSQVEKSPESSASDPRESVSQVDGDQYLGSSATIASDSLSPRSSQLALDVPGQQGELVPATAGAAHMYKKKVSLLVLGGEGDVPAITVEPPSTFHSDIQYSGAASGIMSSPLVIPPIGIMDDAGLHMPGSGHNSARNSVVAAGGDNLSLSSARNSLKRESIKIPAEPEKGSRQSSNQSKAHGTSVAFADDVIGNEVPKFALNGEDASMDEVDEEYLVIEAFLLEDVPDPDMEDIKEDIENQASILARQHAMAEFPISSFEEPMMETGGRRGNFRGSNGYFSDSNSTINKIGTQKDSISNRPRSHASILKSRESFRDSSSNISRPSLFGGTGFIAGSLQSLSKSVFGGTSAAPQPSPLRKKRPPRARMGSARSNYSFASESSGGRLDGSLTRDSVGHRIVSIDSISIVEEEGEVAGSLPPTHRARSASALHEGRVNEEKEKVKDGGVAVEESQETADGEQIKSVPSLVVELTTDEKSGGVEVDARDADKLQIAQGLNMTRNSSISSYGVPKGLAGSRYSGLGSLTAFRIDRSTQSRHPSAQLTRLKGEIGSLDIDAGTILPSNLSIPAALSNPYLSQTALPPSNFQNLPPHPPLMRRRSLPTHPDFVSKAFRSIPKWVPVKAKVVALICIVITIGATASNLIYNTFTVVNYYANGGDDGGGSNSSIGVEGGGGGGFAGFATTVMFPSEETVSVES
ncbi:hypothetical protein HDU97_007848 [Phlyctochytrium planicorne]|nr:hypothetical protein HDU97_007848 [Phlyctochytrium planicorne]